MDHLRQMQYGNSDFAFRLYKQLFSHQDGNMFFSPQSVSVALAMVLLGTRGHSAIELKNALGLTDISDENIHSGFLELHEKMENCMKNGALKTACRIFPEKDYTIQKTYVANSSKFYHTEIETLNYKKKSEESRISINKWTNEKTEGKIKELIPKGSISSATRLVLADAIYFKGEWQHRFYDNSTLSTDFYVNNDTVVKVEMMSQKRKFKIHTDEVLDVEIVELPYRDEEISMLLLVPLERYGLSVLEDKLTLRHLLHLTPPMFSESDIILSLPKMTLEYSLDLEPSLKKLGVHDLFIKGKASLQGIAGYCDLHVSNVFHKAALEVSEDGIEIDGDAAPMIKGSHEPPHSVTCDHPFLFLIKHNPTQSILFIGRYVSP